MAGWLQQGQMLPSSTPLHYYQIQKQHCGFFFFQRYFYFCEMKMDSSLLKLQGKKTPMFSLEKGIYMLGGSTDEATNVKVELKRP